MRLSVLAVSTLLSPVLLAQTRVPEIEPNNNAAAALANPAFNVGDQIDCNLVAGEQDWFRFSLAAAGRIRIHTSCNTTVGADTRIALLDATGTVYRAIDDDARGSTTSNFASEIQLNVSAGAFMVQVVGFGSTSAGLYSLEVDNLTPVVYDGVEVEPNNSAATATPTGVLGLGNRKFHGTVGADAVVGAGVADVPVLPPVVNAGLCSPPAIVFSGTAGVYPNLAAVAFSTTVTPSVTPLGQPMANPPLTSYVPGMNIAMTSGPNVGLGRLISSNTAVSITAAAFPAANAAGNTYDIVTANSTTVTWVPSLPLASLYVGGSGYSLRMVTGVNAGLTMAISANTGPSPFGSEITHAAFPAANAPGDAFEVICTGSTTAIRVLPLVPNAYNPTTGVSGTSGLGAYNVRFTSGANVGLVRQISGNTASSITLASALTAAPALGDTFNIEQADVDYYQVVLTAPSTGFWFQINEGDDSFVYGHRYELYDAAGNALLPASSLQLPAFGTQNAVCSTLTPRTSSARVLPAGTYYVAVRAPQPSSAFTAAATMPGGVVPSGNYALEIYTMPMDTGATVVEAEPIGTQSNNTVATAQPFTPGAVLRGNVTASTGADPSDWYGPIFINVPSTISYQGRRAATATPMLDSTINLRDSNGALALTATTGNVLDVPTSSTTGLHGRTIVTFYLTPGTYYIDITSPGTTALPAMFGDYEIETSGLMPAPYVAASFTSLGGNNTSPCATTSLADAVPAASTALSGSVTAVSTTTSIVTTGLVSGAWATGYALQMTSGAQNGLIRAISANTATSITVAAFPAAPLTGDTWNIITNNTTTLTYATTPLVAGTYANGFYSLQMTSGPNSGLIRAITANSASTITTAAFPAANVATNTFLVVQGPVLTRQFTGEVPAMGSLYSRQVANCNPFAPFIHMLGFSNTLASGSIPLPADLSGAGITGCSLNVDPVILTAGMCDGAGVGEVQTVLPPITAFRGFVWYEQAIVQNVAANPFGANLTNYGRVITGERTY